MDLQLFIDRLQEGQIEKFSHELPPEALGLTDIDLSFTEKVSVSGTAYVAIDHLILKLQADSKISMPCSICNEQTEMKIELSDFYHTELLSDISGGVFDFTQLLREDLLLQVPHFTECNKGKCPERESITHYLKKETALAATSNSGPTHYPFSNL
ncbi:MAG: hypothetical protein NTZ52_00570 [Chlamydiae bacterium]|nr:hypothetical protein [Chlamydiota bacterium]